MLYTVSTDKTPEQAGKDLEAAASRHQFGVLAVHDLQASMAKHNLAFPNACRIYEVCQPQQAKRVLEANLAMATVLPCRIAVYTQAHRTTLAMIKPTALLSLFHEPGLDATAREVEQEMTAIMDEAARP